MTIAAILANKGSEVATIARDATVADAVALLGKWRIGALFAFWWNNGFVSVHFFIATAGAIIASMMLTAALMGLVFLSSGSGHDEAIDDPFKDEADRD